MIVRSRPNLMAVLFTLQGSILPRVALKVSFITVAAIVVVTVERAWPHPFPMSAGIGPFTLVRAGALDLPELPQRRLLRPLVGGAQSLGNADPRKRGRSPGS